ncbi:Reticulon-4 [Mactra antiquata]
MQTVDPRDNIDTSLKSDMDETSLTNSECTSPSNTAESLTGPFNGGESDIGNLATDTNKHFDKDSDSSSIISSSDNEYSSSADESDSESGNDSSDDDKDTNTYNQADKLVENINVDIDTSSDKVDELEDFEHRQSGAPSGFENKLLNMDLPSDKDTTVGINNAVAEEDKRIGDDVDGAIVEHDEVESMEKDTVSGAESKPMGLDYMADAVTGLSETDMLDVIERLTKDDSSSVNACSVEPSNNVSESLSLKDEEYERFIRGEEVLSVDNASPIVSDHDIVGNELGSDDSKGSESDESCTDSDVSGDEDCIANWSPSPLYAGILDPVSENQEQLEDIDMDVDEEESGVLAGYEYEDDTEVIQHDNELNTLRADVKGLMEEMEAIVQDNDKSNNKRDSQLFVEEVLEDLNKTDIENVPEILKGNEGIVSIMSGRGGSRERSWTPDSDVHVKFQNPTNVLFYDPDCPIVEKVSAEMSDELIDHDQSYPDQQVPETSNEIDEIGLETRNAESVDLNTAVVKDLKDVYNILEAKGEIDSTAMSPSDGRNINDIATEFSNAVLDEACKETLESLEDSKDKQKHDKPEVFDSFYPKKPNAELNMTSYLVDDLVQHVNTPLQQEEVMAFESIEKVECELVASSPSTEQAELPSLPRKNVNIESDKEIRSEVLPENDTENRSGFLPENDQVETQKDIVTDNDSDHDEVVMRRKQVDANLPEELNDEDSFTPRDTSRSGSMVIHDVDDSDIQNDVSEAVKQTLAAYRPSRIDALNEEFRNQPLPEAKHPVVGLDEVEKKRRLSSSSIEPEDHEMIMTEDQLNYTDDQIAQSSEPEEDIVEEKFEVFDHSLNETVIPADFDKHEVNDAESFAKDNNESIEQIEQNPNIDFGENSDNVGDIGVCSGGFSARQILELILEEVLDLIYWRDVKKTGVVFGTMLFVLLSLTFCTILSVAAYLSLAILTVTLSFRVYKNVMQAIQKTNEGHPFKKLLAIDISLREDVVQNAAEKIASNMNNCCKELRRLFLVEDYVDSLKFGLLLWLMTYVGSWFNGMTLVILAVVSIFTLPKVYETYQGPIDQNVNLVRGQLNNIMTQVSSKIPFPKKKAKTQ